MSSDSTNAEQKWKFLRNSEDPYLYYDVFGEPEEIQQLIAIETVLPRFA